MRSGAQLIESNEVRRPQGTQHILKTHRCDLSFEVLVF